MKKALIVSASALLPVLAFAQLTNLQNNIIRPIGNIINLLIPIVFALAVLYFFWGLAQYILNANDDTARAEGRSKMIWGIVALFVMASVWGLVRFIGTSVGIGEDAAPTVTPLIPKP
jgi:hypothetical protein